MALCLAFGKYVNAQYECLRYEGTRDNTIQFTYTQPQTVSVIDTILPTEYGISQTFSFINMGDEDFGLIDSVGLPLLPQLSFEVNVPINATGLSVALQNADIRPVQVSYPFLPAQADIVKDSSANMVFGMDTAFYSSTSSYPLSHVSVVDEYKVFGEKGVTIRLCPFIYSPNTGTLSAIYSATVSVSVRLDENVGSTPVRRYTEDVESYLYGFFANYIGESHPGSTHNYLIITSPEFASNLAYFENYKHNLGYNVTTAYTNQIGTTASAIKAYIQGLYNNASTRPDYILLVGNTSHIPQFEGTSNNVNDPVTDLGYSLLDGNDLKADAFLGRFPVANKQELKNIVNKTIFMEMNLANMDKKATFIAGDHTSGSNIQIQYMTNSFESAHNYVINHTFVPNGYSCDTLYQPNSVSIVTQNLANNPLFVVYSGHGDVDKWAGVSFYLYNNNVSTLSNAYFPFTFAFSCLTGKYNDISNIGIIWVKNRNKGAVTYYGSSINTLTHTDKIIEKKIFNNSAFSQSPSISSLINQGMNKFRLNVVGWFYKRYLKSYNLMGDPSLHIGGFGCLDHVVFDRDENIGSDNYTEYRVANYITNLPTVAINLTNASEVHFHAGDSIVLENGFNIGNGANFTAEIEPCGSSTRDGKYFSDNGKPKRDFESIEESVIDNSNNISLHPNPTTGMVQISTDKAIRQVAVTNLLGSTMLETSNPQGSTIDVSALPAGVYIVRVVTADGKESFAKLVKK